jgi:hypothetical protein
MVLYPSVSPCQKWDIPDGFNETKVVAGVSKNHLMMIQTRRVILNGEST